MVVMSPPAFRSQRRHHAAHRRRAAIRAGVPARAPRRAARASGRTPPTRTSATAPATCRRTSCRWASRAVRARRRRGRRSRPACASCPTPGHTAGHQSVLIGDGRAARRRCSWATSCRPPCTRPAAVDDGLRPRAGAHARDQARAVHARRGRGVAGGVGPRPGPRRRPPGRRQGRRLRRPRAGRAPDPCLASGEGVRLAGIGDSRWSAFRRWGRRRRSARRSVRPAARPPRSSSKSGPRSGRQLGEQLVDLALGEAVLLQRRAIEARAARRRQAVALDLRPARAAPPARRATRARRTRRSRSTPRSERRDALQHAGHHAPVLLDLPLRVRVDAQRQEVQQVVQVDLPVPLRVRRQRQVDARQLARDLVRRSASSYASVLSRRIAAPAPHAPRRTARGVDRLAAAPWLLRWLCVCSCSALGRVEQHRHQRIAAAVFVHVAVRCRIHCRAMNIGMQQWNFSSTISLGVVCRCRRR